MEHSKHNVDLLDAHGRIIGQTARYQINKTTDIYHTIHIILITPQGELVLSMIPVREDLPNTYARKIGTTVATIRRTGESAWQAARRSSSRELFIDAMPLTLVGEDLVSLPGDHISLMSVFYGVADPPDSFSLLDIDSLIVMTPKQFRLMLENEPEKIAPSLTSIWERYYDRLPL